MILASLIGAGGLLVAFLIVEARQEHAMLDLSLFRKPAFTGVSVVAWALSAGMFAMFLYLTLYVQDVLGYSPLEAGVRFLPITLLSFFVAPIAGRLTGRVPARVLLGLGLILVGVGLLLMRGIELGDDWTTLLPGFLVAGVGIGLTNPAIASTAIGVVAPFRAGMASGINNTFRQVGIATGVAALGRSSSRASTRGWRSCSRARRRGSARRCRPAAVARRSSRCPGSRAQVADAANQAFISGFNDILLVGAAIAITGGIVGFALVR